MKDKFIANIRSLFKSFINNKELFKRRNNSFIVPLISFLLIIFLLCFPTYMTSKKVKSDSLMKNFPQIQKPMEALLTGDLDCIVKNGILTCSENSNSLNIVVGDDDDIKYTVIANQTSITNDTSVVYSTPKDSDNLIILLNNYIRIRYIERDYVEEKIYTYEIIGDYTTFENYNFKEISQKLTNDPTLIENEVSNFILKTYLSTLDTQLVVKLSSTLLSFSLLIIVSCIVMKGSFLFKKKGFKYSDCLKISLTSAFPSLIVSFVIYLLFGIDFVTIFGLAFIIRILFIYFKYIFPNNNIFQEIYVETKDERFNVR